MRGSACVGMKRTGGLFSFAYPGKTKGSSDSGLVQLPPSEGKETRLSEEESDESEMPEQADSGRLILSPADECKSHCVFSFSCLSKVVRILANGVLGGVKN